MNKEFFATPGILVVMGATGDLMAKKIAPSIWYLYNEGLLPDRFKVVGFARRKWSDIDFRASVKESLAKHYNTEADEEKLSKFLEFFTYQIGDFDKKNSFIDLDKHLKAIDMDWMICTNKLFYLAVPPVTFEPIFKHMADVGLDKPCGGSLGWTRVIVEKPFGYNLKTARGLISQLKKYFKKEQIYLVDHYLAKEIIQGIIHFRFSNNLLESSWSNKNIEKIEIKLWETIGVENRGGFYDAVGAWRDVGQNHLVQMLAAVTMDYPNDVGADKLRQKRAEIINSLVKLSKDKVHTDVYRGQYEGYQQIVGVKPNSQTETFFKIKTELDHPVWRGVPITFESGKSCFEARKEIVVTFKKPLMCLACQVGHQVSNQVVFTIEPEDRITIKFWTKKPGFEQDLEERSFTFFLYEKKDKIQYVEEYSKLILECMRGNQSMFVSPEEIEAMWRFADPITNAFEKNLTPLNFYAPNTNQAITMSEHIGAENTGLELSKTIGLIGLGKMGANLARNMMEHGWKVIGYNRNVEVVSDLAKEGVVKSSYSIPELVSQLPNNEKKIVWLMVPAGEPVDEVLFGKSGLTKFLKKGDIVIDGGNSFYKDTVSRNEKLKKFGIVYMDAGTSGGPGGARDGACLMVGGDQKTFGLLEPLFRDISKNGSYKFFAGAGAGHFVKMIHNGIEYGMMQAIAEGFAVMKKSKYNFDLTEVAEIYNQGSVVESRLVGWLHNAFIVHGQDLKEVSGKVSHTGEGAWTIKTAKEFKIKTKVIEEALNFRIQSQKNPDYTGKILSALRGQFGKHAIK